MRGGVRLVVPVAVVVVIEGQRRARSRYAAAGERGRVREDELRDVPVGSPVGCPFIVSGFVMTILNAPTVVGRLGSFIVLRCCVGHSVSGGPLCGDYSHEVGLAGAELATTAGAGVGRVGERTTRRGSPGEGCVRHRIPFRNAVFRVRAGALLLVELHNQAL